MERYGAFWSVIERYGYRFVRFNIKLITEFNWKEWKYINREKSTIVNRITAYFKGTVSVISSDPSWEGAIVSLTQKSI